MSALRRPPSPAPRRRRALVVALAPGLLALAHSSCGDPVVDVAIAALGPENAAVPPGEFHRPGQDCVICHSALGGVSPHMSLGGTVFATPFSTLPVSGAVVRVVDSAGEQREFTTNCIGNFFAEETEWKPQFPLAAEVRFTEPGTGLVKVATMGSRIGRDGGCGSCHKLASKSTSNPGQVYCLTGSIDAFPPVDAACPGVVPEVPQ